jgi:hypothetical protein
LPWELLHDPGRDLFLATAADIVLSRYLPVPEPAFWASPETLKILLVVESPPGLPEITGKKIDALKQAIDSLGATANCYKAINLTLEDIQTELQKDYHLFHLVAHGSGGKLYVISDDKQGRRVVGAREFANLMPGRRSLRLVLINACHSSQPEGLFLFAGVGPALIRQGIPAVIAMQYPTVQLDTATKFSGAFYQSLANGKPADLAVNEARQLLSTDDLADLDWSTPILYLGTRSGDILNLPRGEAVSINQAWRSVQVAAGPSGAAAALTVLAQRFKQIHVREQRLSDLLTLVDKLAEVQEHFRLCLQPVDPIYRQPDENIPHTFLLRWRELVV